MRRYLPPLFLLFLLFAQCKVIHYTPGKFPAHQIIFGEGGGFTSTETSYVLLENGQLFKQTGTEGAYTELKPIKSSAAKEFFSEVGSLQLYKMDIQQPGNIYYFLQEVNESIDSRVVWGAGDYVPPRSVVSVYKDLRETANEREVVKENIAPVAASKKEEKEKKEKSGW